MCFTLTRRLCWNEEIFVLGRGRVSIDSMVFDKSI